MGGGAGVVPLGSITPLIGRNGRCMGQHQQRQRCVGIFIWACCEARAFAIADAAEGELRALQRVRAS